MNAARFEPFPLTDQQQAYLVGRASGIELGNVSTHAYYEYEGELDLDRFNRAWERLIDRHDMLRVVVDPDHQQQRILESVPPFAAEVVDLRGLADEQVRRRLVETRDRLSHEVRPADRYPVYGVVVSRLDDARARVHISFDGLTLDYLSWQLLVADLTRFYDDPDLELAPLDLTFRDYVQAEIATRDGEQYRRAEAYWKARAATLPPSPQLPLAVDPSTVTQPHWTSRETRLDAEHWTALKARASKAGLTPTALMLAVFAEVLATWSESPRFTINVPRMNRLPLHPQANEVLGEFASFSLLEVDHRGDVPFGGRAAALQRQLWQDLMHQQVSGVRVLRELMREQGGFQRALMPVVLTSTLGFTAGERPLLGSRLPRVFAVSQTPQVYLDVQIEEQAGALVYNWDSVDQVLSSEVVSEAFAAFGALLHRLAVDDETWERTDLGLVPEHHHTRGGIAGPTREVPDRLVQSLFEDQLAQRADQAAVITSALTLTYAELSSRAHQVAHWLRAHGNAPDRPVAIVMAKGWEQVVAAYGVLFAGSPYLPVDAALPPNRIQRLLEQAGVRQVLTQSALVGGLAPSSAGRDVLLVDDMTALALPAEPVPPTTTPDDLAYVLFTSGSTGQPKGVMIEHRGMVNCLLETIAEHDVRAGARCLAVTALHHDMSTFDVFGVLGAGGSVVIPDADRSRDAAHWAELLAAHDITVWNSVPAMMEMLLEEVGDRGDLLDSLRLVFLGGDWIPLRVPRVLGELVDGIRVVSVGGPTETTLWNIWHPVERVEQTWRSVPYGRPIANTRYFVMDPWLRDRPEGVTGELHCAGPGVARGYWDDEERTDASFLRHPVTGERIYRTGDLGRCDRAGTLEFVGRADQQVKIRGQRIEPGEVESALAAVPGVRAAVVTPVPYADRPGHRALAAHVTADPGLGPDAVRAVLREQLPEHMVPATITVLDHLPLTANGKVDRRALATAAPATDRSPAPAAVSPLEQVIAGVWAEVIGVGQVGVDDDFFGLGGDSVLATRIVVRLRDVLDTPELAVVSVLSTVTVRGLAEVMLSLEETPGRLARIAELYLHIQALTDDDLDDELVRL